MIRIAACLALAFASPVWAAISGTVNTTNGTPIENARVAAYRIETTESEKARIVSGAAREVFASAVTGANGAFSIDPKRDGVFDLLVERDGFAPQRWRTLAGESELAIDLEAAAKRTGRVTAEGKPVASAIVVAHSKEGFTWSTRTDEQGIFTIADPKRWIASMTIVHPGYAVATSTDLEIELVPGIAISGTVLTSNGGPAANARLLVDEWPAGVSKDDGTFVLRHVAAGAKKIAAIAGSERAIARAANGVQIRLQESRTITGTVRDANKRMLAGALLTAYPSRVVSSFGYAVTDEKGSYRVELNDPGVYNVLVEDVGDLTFTPASANLQSSHTRRADFTADATERLRGIVVDEQKRPVPGALVQLFPAQIPPLYAVIAEPSMARARTGVDGRFKLPAASDDSSIVVQALHPRYAVTRAKIERPLRITLREGVEVRGIVTAEGKPLAGAGITAMQDPFGATPLPIESLLNFGSGGALIESDAEGKFTLHLNEAPHDLAISKDGFVAHRLGDFKPVAGQKLLEIELTRGAEIRGRIVAKGARQTVAGVISSENEDGSFANAVVGEDGTFVLGSLRPGKYRLEYVAGRTSSISKEVTAPADDVVIELPSMAEVRGRVVDKASREPITRYRIRSESGENIQSEEADSETFTIPVAPGSVAVTVEADGYIAETAHATASLEKPAEVTFALTRGRTIAGRVTSQSGTPVAEAGVRVDDEEVMQQYAQSDEEGEYQLTGVAREPVTIEIRGEGYLTRRIAVDGGISDQRVDVVLAAGRKATGRVVTASGEAVANARLWARPVSGMENGQSGTSGADGTFTIGGLGEGLHVFSAGHEEHGNTETAEIDPAAGPVVIAFKRSEGTGTVRGTVKGFTDGNWLYGSVMTESGAQGLISRDGTYRIEKVPAGEVRLRANAGSMREHAATPRVTANVPANGEVEVDLEFRTDITVRGTVTEEGQAAYGRSITFSSGEGSWQTTTGEGGAYAITGLEPAMYTVSVQSGRRQFTTRHQVTGSATFDVAISFTKIEGRVVDSMNAPVPGVTIEVSDGRNQTLGRGSSDQAGAFSVSTNRADAFVVNATKKGFATAVQSVTPDGPPIVLRLQRSEGLRVRLVDARNGATLSGYVVATNEHGLIAGRGDRDERNGITTVPLPDGAYRVSVSANGFASQSRHVALPFQGELSFALTPGGTLIVRSDRKSSDLVKLIHPNGEEYVRCQCNGIAEIRLSGTVTTIENVAPGNFTMQVLDAKGRVMASYPVTVTEGATTTAEIHVPD